MNFIFKHFESGYVLLRVLCCLLIVLFGLLDLLFLKGSHQFFWFYSCVMVGLTALCCIAISGWGSAESGQNRWSRITRQCLHWLGFAGVVYLLDSLIAMGTFLPQNAGLILLGLLGFCVYLAGLTIDWWLVLVGIVLVLLAMSVVWVHQHLWLIVIPLGVAVAFLLILMSMVKKRKGTDAP